MISHCKRQSTIHKHHGFTLVEIAVVMLIFSLLAAGAVSALRVQSQRATYQDTQTALTDSRDALLGFATTMGRLPCPADPLAVGTVNEGLERGACATAPLARGLVPWRTLGIQALDAWNQRLTYQVAPELTANPAANTTTFVRTDPPAAAATTPQIVDSTGTLNPVVTPGTAAFAIWSHGANGHFAVNLAGFQQPANTDPTGPFDEASNNPTITAPTPIVSRTASEQRSPLNDFDDTTIWMSKFTLFKHLLDAGYAIP